MLPQNVTHFSEFSCSELGFYCPSTSVKYFNEVFWVELTQKKEKKNVSFKLDRMMHGRINLLCSILSLHVSS